MSGAMLQLDGVTRAFGGRPALSSISLELEPGRHTAVIGASGCGKTTLLRLLAGLDAPSAGRITMNGRLASAPSRIVIPPHERGVAMVFQDLALWPNLSALGNVVLALSGATLSRKQARVRADLAGRKPGQLSGGQQQRVALARAVAARPRLLLLDEPFAGLDLLTKDHLLAQIRELALDVGFTILLVTHDPFEAAHLCRHVLVLDSGRVAESGDLRELARHGRSELVRRFAAVNS